jgi:hypothetical protein
MFNRDPGHECSRMVARDLGLDRTIRPVDPSIDICFRGLPLTTAVAGPFCVLGFSVYKRTELREQC